MTTVPGQSQPDFLHRESSDTRRKNRRVLGDSRLLHPALDALRSTHCARRIGNSPRVAWPLVTPTATATLAAMRASNKQASPVAEQHRNHTERDRELTRKVWSYE